ncbi:hypothetical protein H6P81_009611 [Aristolochia fimbriata]|uniref:Peptidase metallopeptidase domain-containing protein n=1 Tax=Aristolochia fimbriata TaxID=158543 RepID=A0AAV7EMH9_ARIFI|nr:hypothetical protein H6P81_009611 [Aristolochia fimbriata]
MALHPANYFSPLLLLLLLLLFLFSDPNPVLGRPLNNPGPHPAVNFSNPFGFLHHLVGCHKGENVTGLHQLKQYLHRFGYLHEYSSSSKDDQYFDDLVESAIMAYQRNYHLNVTGMLDPQTAEQMSKPRCGVPDSIEGTMSGSSKQPHLHTVAHYSYFGGSPRWADSDTHLTYAFADVGGANDEFRSAAGRAFGTWASVTRFTFEEVGDYESAKIKIGVFRGGHGDGADFDGPGGVLAHAFAPTVGLFHLDGDETWSTNPGPTQFDLESVALHEIGHLLGLFHSEDKDAVMFSGISPGVRKTTLNNDDVAGIRALYNL